MDHMTTRPQDNKVAAAHRAAILQTMSSKRPTSNAQRSTFNGRRLLKTVGRDSVEPTIDSIFPLQPRKHSGLSYGEPFNDLTNRRMLTNHAADDQVDRAVPCLPTDRLAVESAMVNKSA